MEVVPEPAHGAEGVLVSSPKGSQVMFRGNKSNNYLCGDCGVIICENVQSGMFVCLIFKGFNCSVFNRFSDA